MNRFRVDREGNRVLRNGAYILRENGVIVLAVKRGEFVTWTYDTEGATVWGHYFGPNFSEAEKDYEIRVKRGY